MKSDFSDLRFTKADGVTTIDAWLESHIASTSAVVWVEFPTTPANTVTEDYYVYYGNSSAASDWDIGATFLFGDDFTNGNNWTFSNTNLINVENGVMRVKPVAGGADAYVTSKPTLGDNFVQEYDYKPTYGFTYYGVTAIGVSQTHTYDGGTDKIANWHYGGESSGNQRIYWRTKAGGTTYDGTEIKPYITNEVYKFQATKNGASAVCKIWDTSHSESSPNTNNTLTVSNSYEFPYIAVFTRSGHTQPAVDISNFRIRKYATNPATYSFGSEESNVSGNAKWYYDLLKRRNQ